ncbi:MAG TPA: Gfo/Idh/MocA family oxidoreductase [Saprospiraceae bacterium]|nr:Gfo/Idh/MocA family oxidoreductase [Saprospiraceae bacterium]
MYNYENFDKIIDNPSIDIVYIVLPNSMHAEYSIRASKAGKHVICEKPMALSVSDCDQMIAASRKANKLLSIGYRLHFEPYNQEMMRLGLNYIYGNLLSMDAGFGITLDDPNQWRLRKSLAGGGPLQDVGIYCIQGICYTSGMVPKSVLAQEGQKTDSVKFREVEESLSWEFEMENGIIAKGHSSYSTGFNYLKAVAENGWFELTSAYGYSGQRGATSDGPMSFKHINQQAKQMDAFALSIKNKKPSIVPGEMGKRDVALIESIYESIASGKRVSIHG